MNMGNQICSLATGKEKEIKVGANDNAGTNSDSDSDGIKAEFIKLIELQVDDSTDRFDKTRTMKKNQYYRN